MDSLEKVITRFFLGFVLGVALTYFFVDVSIQKQQLEELKLINEQLSYIKSDLNNETY